jgi:glycosyltransferase involved in cell wall biosynthesis
MKVSVCVITYNQEGYIRECLQGILDQETLFDVEIVIGEDGSTDGTRRQIMDIIELNPEANIRLLPDEGNLGMMPNFVRTLAACTGEYLAICEGDDYWTDAHKLQKQVDFMDQHPDYSLCFTNNEFYYEQENQTEKIRNSDKDTLTIEDLLQKNWVATQTVLYRQRDDLDLNDRFQSLSVGDWPLHILHAQYGKVGHLDDFTAVYRVHGANSYLNKTWFEKQALLEQMFEYLFEAVKPEFKSMIMKRLERLRYSLASKYLEQGKEEQAWQYYIKLRQSAGNLLLSSYYRLGLKMMFRKSKVA